MYKAIMLNQTIDFYIRYDTHTKNTCKFYQNTYHEIVQNHFNILSSQNLFKFVLTHAFSARNNESFRVSTTTFHNLSTDAKLTVLDTAWYAPCRNDLMRYVYVNVLCMCVSFLCWCLLSFRTYYSSVAYTYLPQIRRAVFAYCGFFPEHVV